MKSRALERLRALTRNIRPGTTIALWTFALVAIGLLVASFVVPPTGVIDPSVLKSASLLFGFAALFEAREAILEGLGVKVTHGDTTIVIHDLDGKQGDAAPDMHSTIVGEIHESHYGDDATDTDTAE